MRRKAPPWTTIATLAAALAGLLGSCGNAPATPAPGLTVTSDAAIAAASGREVTTFRVKGAGVRRVSMEFFKIHAGETHTVRKRVYDALPSSWEAPMTILELPGDIHGRPHQREFELIEALPGGNHGFGEGPATCLDVRDGGGLHVRNQDVDADTATVLWAAILWPANGEGSGGRMFHTVEDARGYTAENAATVVLVALSWN